MLPQIERRDRDEEKECVESKGIGEERVIVVERVKKEFTDLNGNWLKNLSRVLLTQPVINSKDAEPVRNGISRVPYHRVGEFNLILDEMLDANN